MQYLPRSGNRRPAPAADPMREIVDRHFASDRPTARRLFCVGAIRKGVLRILFERPKQPKVVSLDDYRLERRPKDLDGRPVGPKGGAA